MVKYRTKIKSTCQKNKLVKGRLPTTGNILKIVRLLQLFLMQLHDTKNYIKHTLKDIKAAQESALLTISRKYRAVSTRKLQVIAGILYLDLHIEKKKRSMERRIEKEIQAKENFEKKYEKFWPEI